ncbi:hypothetical protein, partial [Weissella confusa]
VGWMSVGGGHHTVLSFKITAEQLQDLANMFKLTYVDIKG